METVLLTGNGINTISNDAGWEDLLRRLHETYYNTAVSFDELKQKPFPLLYEQIVLWQLQLGNKNIETILKKTIAAATQKIVPNKVQQLIGDGKWQHIITANYESAVTNANQPLSNTGCISEQLYSVFRRFMINGKTYWHLHGDALHSNSINLGYEHYCGQLQKMREYVTGTYQSGNSTLSNLFSKPLVNRSYLQTNKVYSWTDLFFKNYTTIKILGFRMELEELDIWWLLTYRAKLMYAAKKGLMVPVHNRIRYFIPRQFCVDKDGHNTTSYKTKKQLLEAMDIEVVEIDIPHSEAYYAQVLRSR